MSDGVVKTIADNLGPFNSTGNISLNNFGGVAFVATLDAGGGQGIFIGPDTISHKVIMTGDPLFDSHLVHLEFFNSGINDFGQIAFRGILADGTEGIYRAEPRKSDSYRCYSVAAQSLMPRPNVAIEDEFKMGVIDDVAVRKAETICVPVDKDGNGIISPDTVFTCYSINQNKNVNVDVEVSNEFGEEQPLSVNVSKMLCVPSKLAIIRP